MNDLGLTEILEAIHENGFETAVYSYLNSWLLKDRELYIKRTMESEATVRAITKIATQSNNPKTALEGIVNICTE